MSFEDTVRDLLDRCPGAVGAAVVDSDGIAVTVQPPGTDIEALGAEMAAIVRGVDEAGREFNHGPLEQFSVFAEGTVVILTTVVGGYFLLVVLDRDAVVGKARFYSRVAREHLYPEFI